MTTSDAAFLSAHQLAREISRGERTSSAVVEELLDRIERANPKLNAFVEIYREDALRAAKAADASIRSGQAVGPLHGVPIALKDLIELEGRVVTGGSAIWRDRRSTRTATIARRLMAQGVIILGKTQTVEFAMGGWGTNLHMGTPWNPWDSEHARTPGGSSSGSGVAVAAGLAPWAIGTDTGGSVRHPASWCGLTGLKTTIGRVSTHGILPLSSTLDTPGPMTRSVQDAALLYCAIQGADPLDPKTLAIAWSDPWPQLTRGVRGLRLARLPDSERAGVAPEVLAAYDASLAKLSDLGADIVSVAFPRTLEEFGPTTKIVASEGYALLSAILDDEALPLDPDVRPRLTLGRDIRASDYLSHLELRKSFKQEFALAFADCDALLTPTNETAALRLDAVDQTKSASRFTRFVNFMDLCALCLPNGMTSAGLPTSLQIVCGYANEAMALRIGYALQNATSWHERRPPSFAVGPA